MWAAQIDKYGAENIEVRQVDVPQPGPGYVLVKVEASPINVSDLMSIQGGYVQRPLPRTVGNEGTGVVVASGGGELPDSLLNKRVSFVASGEAATGVWAEYAVAAAPACFVLNDDVTTEEAASLIVNPMTVALFLAKIREGGHKGVVQHAAASALGKMLVRWCNKESIPIVNIVRRQEQAELLHAIGATHVLVETEPNFHERLSQLCQELNVTIGFDPVAGEATAELFAAIQDHGVVYVFGGLSGKPSTISPSLFISSSKRVEGLWLTRWLEPMDKSDKDKVSAEVQSLIHDILSTHYAQEFNLKTVKDAIAYYSQNKTAGKALIRMKYE